MDPTIPLAPVRAFAEPPGVDEAASMLAAAPLDVIGFGFTSSAYVIGADGEAAMISRLERATQGVPVVATGAAATAALRACGVVRLALVSPPWFDAELDGLGARYFSDQGFEVIAHAPCALPPDQARIDPAELIAWVLEWTPPAAEAVFIGGNGMRAVGVIEELEHRLERPVLSANQVLLWSALAKLASPPEVTGYGSLFAR